MAHDRWHEKHHCGRHEIQERMVSRNRAHKNMNTRDTSRVVLFSMSAGEPIMCGPAQVNHLLDECALADDLKPNRARRLVNGRVSRRRADQVYTPHH